MDLEELKRIRKENILRHKKKKKEYYLKKKLQQQISLGVVKPEIDYEKELQSDFFAQTIKNIAKKQKNYVDSRKEKIVQKLVAYKEQKQKYYEQNKEKRLKYDKIYRQKKKEELKAYRKEYYEKNREKILAKQREKRKLKSLHGK